MEIKYLRFRFEENCFRLKRKQIQQINEELEDTQETENYKSNYRKQQIMDIV